MTPDSPKAEYERRLRLNTENLARAEVQDLRIANTRLAVFILFAAIAWAAYRNPAILWAWLAAPALAFVALIVAHQRVLTAIDRARTLVTHYQRALDRLEGNWMGRGAAGESFSPPGHPYAGDLDIFGHGSLFELLCAARTRIGQTTLASWLLSPAAPQTVKARQVAVAELRDTLELREDLALLGDVVERHVDAHSLAAWVADPAVFSTERSLHVARIAAGLSLLALIVWPLLGAWLFLLMLAGDLILLALWRKPLAEVAQRVEEPQRELAVLARVLARLERESWRSPLLQELRHSLATQDGTASKQLARLDRLVYFLELPANQLFAPVAIVTLWPVHVAHALESWRARAGRHVPAWLDAVGALEALLSLAAYAYEHPGDPFPTFTEEMEFHATGLAHPILREAVCVRNDVTLGPSLRLLIVSGSNMSGKSTLLRMVGANAVLAQAGAPVRAHELRLSPCHIGATLHVQDSIQAGASRFYAEIARLKQVVDLADAGPTLFLFDEILSGTNSHDRRVGAAEILAALLARGAIGMITTHDLALTQLAERFGAGTLNAHFTDEWHHGRLVFPYRLMPGVVQQGNALRLMESLGLPVTAQPK